MNCSRDRRVAPTCRDLRARRRLWRLAARIELLALAMGAGACAASAAPPSAPTIAGAAPTIASAAPAPAGPRFPCQMTPAERRADGEAKASARRALVRNSDPRAAIREVLIEDSREKLAWADRAMRGDGAFCSELPFELKGLATVLTTVAGETPPVAASVIADLQDSTSRVGSLRDVATKIDHQPLGKGLLHMSPARAGALARALLQSLDAGLRDESCVQGADGARVAEVALGLFAPPGPAAVAVDHRVDAMARLCNVARLVYGKAEGRVRADDVLAHARAVQAEVAARATAADPVALQRKASDALGALRAAGLAESPTGRPIARSLDAAADDLAKLAQIAMTRALAARQYGCDPKDPKCDLGVIGGERALAQQHAAFQKMAETMSAAQLAAMPGLQGPEFAPQEATGRELEAIEGMRREGACLARYGRVDEARAQYEAAVARVASTEPKGSALLLEQEEILAGWLSASLGRHAEATDRLQGAIAAFESTRPPEQEFVALALERAYRAVARFARLAGRPNVAAAAEAAAARHAAGHPASLGDDPPSPFVAMPQTIASLEAYARYARADTAALRAELEGAPLVDGLRLLLLHRLQVEAGDPAAALAALRDAAEGADRDLRDLSSLRGMARDSNAEAIRALIELLGACESAAAASAGSAPVATTGDDAPGLVFWLAEARKARSLDVLASLDRSDAALAPRLGPDRQARSIRAAQYLSRFVPGGLTKTPCLDAESTTEEVSRLGAIEQALLPSLSAPDAHPIARFTVAGMPRTAFSAGAPAAFVRDVVARLPRGARFVGYARTGTAASGAPPWLRAAPEKYVAFVVGARGVEAVDLGDAVAIDRLVASAAPAAPAAEHALGVADVAPLQALYDRVWRPIDPYVAGATQVYVAPDGALTGVPWAALHDGTQWLDERYSVSEVASARDLLESGPAASPRGPAVVIASTATAPAWAGGPAPPRRTGPEEARLVASHWAGGIVRAGADADARSVLAVRGPLLLHLAAQGVSVDQGLDATPLSAGMLPWKPDAGAETGGRPPAATRPLDDASLRAALVLADASSSDGGLATAYEVTAMDLRGTQLVTLSAPVTSRGAFSREGTARLVGAFRAAGAESVLVSLWDVDDASRSLWMDAFYAALARGAPRRESMRAASAFVRARYPLPFHWAGFALIGATGPLRPAAPP